MTSDSSAPRLALLMLVVGAMCIAFAPIFVRLADVGPVSVVAWRLGLSIPFALFWWWQIRHRPATPSELRDGGRPGLMWLGISGVLLAIDLALWHVSVHFTSVANSTFILNLAPIFVTIGAWSLFGERVGGGFALALVSAIAGAALLVRASIDVSMRDLTGDLIALAAAVFYAGYQLSVKHCRKYYATAHILAGTAIVTPIVLAPVIFVMDEKVIPTSLQGWAAVIGIALVCQVIGQGLITSAVRHIKANLASVVLLVQPVTAAWLAVLLFNEQITLIRLLGCVLVLAGIVLARRSNS